MVGQVSAVSHRTSWTPTARLSEEAWDSKRIFVFYLKLRSHRPTFRLNLDLLPNFNAIWTKPWSPKAREAEEHATVHLHLSFKFRVQASA